MEAKLTTRRAPWIGPRGSWETWANARPTQLDGGDSRGVYNGRMAYETPLSHAVVAMLVGAVLSAASSAARAAEEAVDADGRATPGVLALDDAGRLRFTPNGQAQALPLESIAYVRFSAAPAAPLRAAFIRGLLLPDGQHLTGRFLSADGDTISLRTAWAGRVDAPRSAAVALRQLPGFLSVFEDDFSEGLQAWTVGGKPAVDGDPPAAGLSGPGQSLAYRPAEPPEAGRVGVNFHDRDAAGARWTAAFHFQGQAEPRTLRVTLAGHGDAYEVEWPGPDGDGRRIARSPGWHRLTVRFSHDSLSVLCDDAVLWSDLRHGPGGALRQVSLRCAEAGQSDGARGRVEFAEFALCRTADEPLRPPGDPTQEEVWLADGDQLFGEALRIDRRAVEIQGLFGKRSLQWAGVRGCWFKAGAAPAPAAEGTRVRLWVNSGAGPEPDVVDGVLKAIDDKQLTLIHAQLGEPHVARDRLRRLRPL
jgi:PH (Pleckstrin Homology) domain-containing protein